MDSIGTWVSGQPWTQGSKSAVARRGGGRPVIIEGNNAKARQRHLSWREAVRHEFAGLMEGRLGEMLQGPVAVSIDFYLERPTTARRLWRWAFRRFDLDKLCRSVLDSLKQAGVYRDDTQVSRLTATKLYALGAQPTGACIRIDHLEHEDAPTDPYRLLRPRPPGASASA